MLALAAFELAAGADPQPARTAMIPRIAKDIKNFINVSIIKL
jgi:hypothetical protein